MTTTAVGYHLMARLTGPPGLDRLEDLVREEYSLGRGDPTRVIDFAVPEDEYLSRVHCRLLKAGETYAVENLSPNGTRVNGKVITKVTALKHKDRVECGGMTVLEFLALSDEERSKELMAGAPAGAAAKKKAAATKPFTKRPVFFALIGFYVLIGVAVLAAVNQSAPAAAPDPGAGPYFRWILKAPLLWDADEAHRKDVAERMWEDKNDNTPPAVRDQITKKFYDRARLREHIPEGERRRKADEKWTQTLAVHASGLGAGAHDYYLVDAALDVLGFRGFATLKAALDAKDPVAVEADLALHGKDGSGGLEGRVRDLYLDATRFARTGLWRLARERCSQIIEAIPDRYVPVRQWAAERLGAPPPK